MRLHGPTILDSLATSSGEADNVRNLVATAPKATRDLLVKLATYGPYLCDHEFSYPSGRAAPKLTAWAVERGLPIGDGTRGAPLEMPREIALALRGKRRAVSARAAAGRLGAGPQRS